jgi:hypothetical protein
MRTRRPAGVAALALCALALAAPARADITAFLGYSPSPGGQAARGFAVGFGLLFVGFEFEYSTLSEDADEARPGIRTGLVNGLLQTIPLGGIQLYFTAGGGAYQARLQGASDTDFATNVGGGAKVKLAGPLRLRLDYRVVTLRGEPFTGKGAENRYHRLYAGVNLAF